VANPGHVYPLSCTYEGLGSWVESPGGYTVYISPNVYNCSGQQYVDSIDWYFASNSGGVQFQNWWFYTQCGDWWSSHSGSPNTYLSPNNRSYSAYINQNVPNQHNFDVDSQYNPGGEWTACM
jgi:hypothetical protein